MLAKRGKRHVQETFPVDSECTPLFPVVTINRGSALTPRPHRDAEGGSYIETLPAPTRLPRHSQTRLVHSPSGPTAAESTTGFDDVLLMSESV